MADLLGRGLNSLIIRSGVNALKIPKTSDSRDASEECRQDEMLEGLSNRQCLEIEKAVYQRAGSCEGIAKCIEITDDGILLALYRRGDLESFIEKEQQVDRVQKLKWICTLIKTLHHLHRRRILVFDLGLRNLMIDDNNDLKMIDFGQASVFPLDSDINQVDDDGMTAQVDIFHLGCLLCSISTWTKYQRDLAWEDFIRPPLDDLPLLDHVLFRDIIRRGWTGGLSGMEQLCQEMDAVQIM